MRINKGSFSIPTHQLKIRNTKDETAGIKQQIIFLSEVLQALPQTAIRAITHILSTVIRIGCYFIIWEITKIIMIEEANRTYMYILQNGNVIPDHQSGFRETSIEHSSKSIV